MSREIKARANIYAGYHYQTLVGVEFLAQWLDDPTLFEWVKFEADSEDESEPQGLDDVVAQMPDGRLLLFQVKFTVGEPGEFPLDWDWLLARSKRGRSLVQKWAHAALGLDEGRLAEAALITNRVPDAEFEAALGDDGKLTLANVASPVKEKLVSQLGTEDRVAQFFSIFRFRHSHKGYLSMERTLADRFVPRHSDRHGYVVLMDRAIHWAIRRNYPAPEGKIDLDLVRSTLNSRRPQPLDQAFRVPDGYAVPSEQFHEALLADLPNSSVHIVWGSPGQGKSTYLSFLCADFEQRGIPYVRHHYFLRLTDQDDRFSFASVANSVMAQMEARHVEHVHGLPTDERSFRAWLEACGKGYAVQGKRFVLVVDGLDHVWRENDRDKGPLDSLFSQIFPVPENVTLIVGTQKVSPDKLPKAFSTFVESNAWRELPRMSLSAIRNWLGTQLDQDRFAMPEEAPHRDQEAKLLELAKFFEERSTGHPLVLTYLFEAAVREHRTLTVQSLEREPVEHFGEIGAYYKVLWEKISHKSKDALHLIADAGFAWPSSGLESCLRVPDGQLDREIGHMLSPTEAGLIPFHGSLAAFVREDTKHIARVRDLVPGVVNWLTAASPAYHRWGWLWIYKKKAGDPEELLTRTDQTWILDSLTAGYPIEQVQAILEEAERAAFLSGRFANAVRLRMRKVRVGNGPDHQSGDYDRIRKLALVRCKDDYCLKTLAVNANTANVQRLQLIAEMLLHAGRRQEAIDCSEQMRQRINDRLSAGAYTMETLAGDLEGFLRVGAATRSYSAKVLENLRAFPSIAGRLFDVFLQELVKHSDIRLLMELSRNPMSSRLRSALEYSSVRLAASCKAKIHEWPEFTRFRKHPISACWRALYAPSTYKVLPFNVYDATLDVKDSAATKLTMENYFSRLFFHALGQSIALGGADPAIACPTFSNRPWVTSAAARVLDLARAVGSLIGRGENPDVALIYRLVDDFGIPDGYPETADYTSFRKALLSISLDVFLLVSVRSGTDTIPDSDWRKVRASRHFAFSEWAARYIANGDRFISNEAITAALEEKRASLRKVPTPFNDRGQEYVELCELALYAGQHSLFEQLLRGAYQNIVGYGWRKNDTMMEVLESIRANSADHTFALKAVHRIAPFVTYIGSVTEDDAVDPSDIADLLLQLHEEEFVRYYRYWLDESEWYHGERVFQAFLAAGELENPHAQVAVGTIWDHRAVKTLKALKDGGSEAAAGVLRKNCEAFGHNLEGLGKERFPGTPTPITPEKAFDIGAYGPTDLDRLIEDLRTSGIYSVSEKLEQWFSVCRDKGQGAVILSFLGEYIEDKEVPHGLERVLDQAFALSLSLEGKKAAYKWLKAAQVESIGWTRFYSPEASLNRLAIAAEHYPERWREFIIETSAYKYRRQDIIIPLSRLVRFLVMAGQVDLAKEVTEEMLAELEDQFVEQPFPRPRWMVAA